MQCTAAQVLVFQLYVNERVVAVRNLPGQGLTSSSMRRGGEGQPEMVRPHPYHALTFLNIMSIGREQRVTNLPVTLMVVSMGIRETYQSMSPAP